MSTGRFITFEGGEGTGKSTQVKLLCERLVAGGHKVCLTREPGGTPGAEEVRSLLVSGADDRWSPEAEALLNYAARDDHIRKRIRPALERGEWVLCDRYFDSTDAYQGRAGGVAADLIARLREHIVGATVPDLTLILDIDVETGLERARRRMSGDDTREDRYESRGKAFHESLRAAFLEIAAENPERCVLIDATASVEQVGDAVWSQVATRLTP